MKSFALVTLFLVFAIQALAQPTPAPAEAAVPSAEEVQPIQPEAEVRQEAHIGAAKDKRAVLVYTSAVLPPYPTFYRYSYVPTFYPTVPATTLFI